MVQKKDSEERSSADINRSKVPSLRPQKSVRRNARKEVLQWDRNDSPDSNLLFGSGINDILSGKSNLLEENSRSLNVKGNSNVEHGESSSQNEKRNDQALNDPKSLLDNETLKPHSVSGDSFGGQLDVKEIKVRDRDKAVEWTKDDEKHLMDLGLTEAERNRRLESLIAKRRARKMFKMAIEKSLMDKGIVPHNHIAPILIVKNNILGFSNHANEEVLQMPGSAPSILLPTQNPFDLPYDPFEEKPNLTGDSFQQEFMAVNQRDTLFCRHESFHHGPLFTFETTPDSINDPFNPYYSSEKRLVRGPEVDRFRKAPDIDLIELEESINNDTINSLEEKSEKITESANDKTEIGETNENPHDLSGSEIRVEIDSTKNNDSCYSASSSDDSESGLDQTAKPLSLCTNQVRKAFNLSIPPKGKTVTKLPFDSSPSPRRTEFNLFYNTYRRQSHTRNCSIASDLQVEVSEVGSITLSTDGTSSPVEGSVTYDGDVERDINSDNEELWGGSFNLSKEANREKLRELDDIIEEDSVEVKVSGLNKKPEEPIASISPSELEKASNVSDKLSPENPGKPVQLTGKSVVHSPSKSCFQKPEVMRENSADNQPHENSTFNMPQSTQRLAENSIQDSSSNCGPATSEEPSCVTKKRTDGSTAHNMNELVFEGTQGNDGSSLKSSKDESKTSTSSEDTEELSKTSGESNLDSIEHPGGSEKLIEHNTRTDSSKPKEGNAKTDDPKTMVREKSAAEVDRVCNVKDSLTNKVTNIESLNPILDGEGEHQILSRQKAVVEPSKTCGETSAGSAKDSKHESTTLTKSEANAGLSTSKGESNSSNNIKNGGDTQNLSGQERLSDASQSREDDLNKAISESISGVDNTATTGISIDHKIATEASKPKEPEVKAVNTKENDSNEVAK
ncbi:hypothetical protein GOBAR_AA23957 [Gossypium barbadense]|uniref:Uncharacterized protein n=1 Tax=Gossypium barbadense TaxID=3634 RepID=A0A2P5X055_GOSBA|nr:hypothetical protein GOBAR_AA23957 [Gossypium barbadense]